VVIAAGITVGSSCGLSYQQRQDMFRERYLTGCQVIRAAPTAQIPGPTEAVADVISGSDKEVERCLLESREIWAELEGTVAIKFTVEPNGSVDDVAVLTAHSTVYEAAVGCCLARIAQTWKFRAPKDGKAHEVEHVFDLVTDIFRFRYQPTSNVGQPQPASGTEIHETW
jgi:TonB family protein